MVSWFSFRARRARPANPRPRASSRPLVVSRVELGDFTPDLDVYLGQAAYLQLALFESLGRASGIAPSTRTKTLTGRVATSTLERHRGLVAEIERAGGDAPEAMQPHRAVIDDFQRRTGGGDWYETILASYVAAGLLNDVFSRLAAGLSDADRERVVRVLEAGAADDDAAIVSELSLAIKADPKLASRLALWGRRLVGDTLLVARAAISASHESADDERLEPVFTELIAAHTRRMDALGLTA
ncbi:ferritin-like fold-containing protein [Frondihabitans australicus]|uniref:tRNA-(MS[2]IO[6]A)-hydroxylase MiaE-like protein n=1 Tax=Frondihabitans australicus TaxID=386892 RepID=A0A495IG17_9MICO|nr:ferritin-like fold-containing protein [Frondihabitans australicus]RKR74884.1 tRNA-(MS[2]IO[6]A)-hydroxylase MiaE-like protein [Frondihabitans australicus]